MTVARKWADWLHHPCRLGGLHCFTAGDKMTSGHTFGQIGYATPTILRVPNGSKQETKSKMGPHVSGLATSTQQHEGVGHKDSGLRVGGLTTSPLLSRGSPTLHSEGQKQRWAQKCGNWLQQPSPYGGLGHNASGPHVNRLATSAIPYGGFPSLWRRAQSHNRALMWADRLHHPCRLGGPERFRVGEQNSHTGGTKSRVGPHVGGLATSPLPFRRSPMLHSGGQNQKSPHMWSHWPQHPCVLGG